MTGSIPEGTVEWFCDKTAKAHSKKGMKAYLLGYLMAELMVEMRVHLEETTMVNY